MKSPVIGSLPAGPEMPIDNVQMLLARKAEIAKNKAKYTLTELDGNLLVTHATELHFVDGQTIVEGGHDVSAVYRIKSGKISIIRNGYACCELSQGWFIGDALFLYDKNSYRMSITMKAKGPVVLLQLDLNFVKQLFTLDITLAMKFYRLIATKNAAIFHQLVNTLHHTPAILCASVDSMPSIDTSSDTSSDTSEAAPIPSFSASSSSSSMPCGSSSQPASAPTPRAVQQLQAKTKRISRSLATEAYKVYPLVGGRHGVQTCRVKTKKIKIVSKSFGFQHKTSIEFSKLQNITKSGENAVTMLYDNSKKATTIFFKNYHDREEFIYLVSSLTTSTTAAPPAIPANQPISTPHVPTEADEEDPQITKNEEHFRQVQVRVELKKGERVFEEGDLYQRVYTLISGSLAVYQKGNFVHNLTEGQVFGVDTILFLRPCSVTIEVASETATLLIITSHKMNELIESDVEMAQRLFKRAAQILDTQITKVLHYEKQQQEKHHSISSSNSSSSISSSGSSSSSSHSHSHGSLPHHSLPLQHSHSAPSVALSDSHGSSSSETEVN